MIFRNKAVEIFNTHAFYHFELQQQAEAWRITKIKQTVLWNEGESRIHQGAK